MQLGLGSAPAPGAASRRPRRLAGVEPEPLNGGANGCPSEAVGEGANRGARGERGPLKPNHPKILGCGVR